MDYTNPRHDVNLAGIIQFTNAKKIGENWVGRCPGHDDKHASFSFRVSSTGKLIFHCHAGCDKQHIIECLKIADLWPKIGATFEPTPAPEPEHSERAAKVAREAELTAKPATKDHPYIARKKIQPYGAVVDEMGKLLIVIRGINAKLVGAQIISPDGEKRFLPGTPVKGNFFLLWGAKVPGPILIAEGYATACTLHEATGLNVVVAFNAGNLLPVAQAVKAKMPDADIVICADNDAERIGGNIGVEKATAAAEAVGGKVAIPKFTANDTGETLTDFNDLAVNEGAGRVRACVAGAQTPEELAEPARTLDEVLRIIEGMSREQVRESWIELFYSMKDHGKSTIMLALDELKKRGLGDKNALYSDWVQYRNRKTRERTIAAADMSVTIELAGRARVDWDATRLDLMRDAAEAAMVADKRGDHLVIFGGVYVRPVLSESVNTAGVKIPSLLPYSPAGMDLRLSRSVGVVDTGRGAKPAKVIAPPSRLLQSLVEQSEQGSAPTTAGLSVHPVVRRDGSIASEDGHDPDTKLYIHSCGVDFDLPPAEITQEAANQARLFIEDTLFSEFEFDYPCTDLSIAVSMLLTMLTRKLLPQCPAYMVSASKQGSGKTTLCRMVYASVIGQDLLTQTLTPNPDETRKMVMGALLRSVPAICFDNLADAETVDDSVISMILTTSTITDRVLGETRMVDANTAATVMLTGNNLTLSSDLVSRVLPIDLRVTDESPESRTFEHGDVLAHCLRNRGAIVKAGLTIIAGYLRAGSPDIGLGGTRFPEWGQAVRAPLVWAGGSDPAMGFAKAKNISVEDGVRRAIVDQIRQIYGSKGAPAGQILSDITPDREHLMHFDAERLRNAVGEISDRALLSGRSLGRVLRSVCGTMSGGYVLRAKTLDGFVRYVSVVVGCQDDRKYG